MDAAAAAVAAVAVAAAARRGALLDAYWAAGVVTRAGVRVVSGEVVGVGRLSLDDLGERMAKRRRQREQA